MTPESPKNDSSKDILFATTLFGVVVFISQLAFSLKVRKEIGKRDHWSCTDCGVGFYYDNAMVHASHYDHNQSLPTYDTPKAGRIQCVDCHQAYHESYVGSAEEIGLTELANLGAIALLEVTERGRK